MILEQLEQQIWNLKNKNTYAFTLEFIDKETGEVEDITGWIIRFTAKSGINDSDDIAAIKKDITVHSDPTNGKTQLTFTSSDTNLLGSYIFDIQVETDDSVLKTLMEGILNVSKRTTIRTS
jgi:hypothetical protein